MNSFRKFFVFAATVAALGLAPFAITSATAHGFMHGGGHGYGGYGHGGGYGGYGHGRYGHGYGYGGYGGGYDDYYGYCHWHYCGNYDSGAASPSQIPTASPSIDTAAELPTGRPS